MLLGRRGSRPCPVCGSQCHRDLGSIARARSSAESEPHGAVDQERGEAVQALCARDGRDVGLPGPSPAAPIGEATWPPSFTAASNAPGAYETRSSTASAPSGWCSRTAAAMSASRARTSATPRPPRNSVSLGNAARARSLRAGCKLDGKPADTAGGPDDEHPVTGALRH